MTRPSRKWARAWIALLPFLTSCGDGPADPMLPELEVVVAGGDGQYGTAGQRLPSPLQAAVRRLDTGAPQEGVTVRWTVESGDASLVTTSVGTTDAQGLVSATVQLGSTVGPAKIRLTVEEQAAATVAFQVFLAERPVLSSLGAQAARGGDTLRVRGSGFSPTPDQNVVLFSGIRGRVVSSVSGEMAVEVPRCLPARTVQVTAQLGELVSAGLPLAVADGGHTPAFVPGDAVDVEDAAGFGCVRLPGGRRYLVVTQVAGTVGAARYGFTLHGLSSAGGVSVAPGVPEVAGGAKRDRVAEPSGGELLPHPMRFEVMLREAEARFVQERGPSDRGAVPLQVEPAKVVPSVGSRRTFKVLNSQGRFDDVQASVRLVSGQAVLYVDDAAPGGGFTEAELSAFARTFDDVIHPTVTRAFGTPSDLDANERVAILFTPAVNRLTPSQSDGFIGGFFYGLDLLSREGSNRGEVFYAVVPDSMGRFSEPRPRELVLRVVPAILAHEFQHMVHFNQRVLQSRAEGTEALWLSEGMAQMAEELVARTLQASGLLAAAEEYRAGNRTRARKYLADPSAVSLIVASGQGSLEERGAGWLYTLFLWDAAGGEELLKRLTRTTLTGAANVAAATGRPWAAIFADWAAALYADGLGGRYPFEYPTAQLRDLLREPGPYPLAPESLGGSDFLRSGSLWSSSARHYIVIPPASGYVALRLGGAAGGNAPAEAALRLRVVPLF
ncbi:MAG: hypothetical protein ACYC6F_06105 [Longimicrobiales bacterium]